MYEIVELLDAAENTVGYAIRKEGTLKLDSLNIYAPEEYDKLLVEVKNRRERALLTQHWPDPNEPEVQALVEDPNFDPQIQEAEHQFANELSRLEAASEVVARQRTGLDESA